MMLEPIIYAGLPDTSKMMVRINRRVSDIDSIIDLTCEALNLSRIDVVSKSRKRELVEARIIATGLILQVNKNISLSKVGEYFGGRDHSTVIYMREMYNDLYGMDKRFTSKVNRVLKVV